MIVQSLKVVPHGLIQSGNVLFKIDETTGEVDFSESIIVGWAFFAKNIQSNGVYKLDPAQLKSANVKVGMAIAVGNLKLEVVSITDNVATVQASYTDQNCKFTGTAQLDLNQDYWMMSHLNATGTAQGILLNLELSA